MNVLITGSSSGLGLSLAKYYLSKNDFVYMTYNNHFENVKPLENNKNVKLIKVDISNEESVINMFKEIDKLDILINNASICDDKDPMDKTELSFNKVIETNLTGTFLVTKHAIKKMSENGFILNISSTNALDTYYPESMDYDASKAGIISLTKNFALYLSNIKVNCICPDWIDTPMNREMDEEIRKTINFINPDKLASYIYDYINKENNTGNIIKVGYEDVR